MTTSVLDTEILKLAYCNGYFPMPDPRNGEICWFNPDPRAILPLDGFHMSRSLKRSIRKKNFTVTINKCFKDVIEGCADRDDTWITDEFIRAYSQLHTEGYCHSLEVWHQSKLAGGVYGVAIGGAFFAESKFHRVTDASKAALYFLTQHLHRNGFELLEVQFLIPHLKSLGAIEIPAKIYEQKLGQALAKSADFTAPFVMI